MAFTVADVRDLVRLLDERPEWRAEVRRQVLSDEFLALPEQVAEQRRDIQRIEGQIAEQRRDIQRIEGQIAEQRLETERRFQRVEDQIAKHRLETEARFEQVENQIAELRLETERRFQRVEDQMAKQRLETEARFEQVENQISALTRVVDTIRNDVGELKGDSLERRYREKATAYFGRLLRRTHVLTDDELNEMLDKAVEQGVLSEDESDEVSWADAIVRGRRRGDRAEVIAVAEISWGVGCGDVQRALRRAELVARMGFTALPVVGGKSVTKEAGELASAVGVWQLCDGKLEAPDSAVPGTAAGRA